MWYWVCFENLAKRVIPNSLVSYLTHHSYVTWASWRLESPVTRLFVQKFAQAHIRQIYITGLTKGQQCKKSYFCHDVVIYHDDVIKWKHFPRNWPFVRGIHRSPVNSPHKGQWRRALMFSLISVWINGWVNNREAGDLRCYRPHYDVTVMIKFPSTCSYFRKRDEACETLALRKSVVSHINQKLKIGITTPDVFAMCYFLAIGDVNMMELKVKNICKRICMSMYKRHIIWVLLSN